MFLVKTCVGPSKIQGLGVFAAEKIPKGTKMWEFIPGVDLKISPQKIEELPVIAQNFLREYSYVNKVTKEHVLSADNDRFINHSRNPNTVNVGFGESDHEGITYALKDIEIGEEITTDYREFDDGNENYY